MELLTYKAASRLLGLRIGTLYSMVSRREIPHVRLGRRIVRFDPNELTEWINARRVAPGVRQEIAGKNATDRVSRKR